VLGGEYDNGAGIFAGGFIAGFLWNGVVKQAGVGEMTKIVLFRTHRRKTSLIWGVFPGFDIFFLIYDLHIRVPAAFFGPQWGKTGIKSGACKKAVIGISTRRISAVFWQIKPKLGRFSTGSEKEDKSGFSGIGLDTWIWKGARIGLIFSQVS